MERLKRRAYDILEVAAVDDRVSSAVDSVILALILASTAAVVFETVPGLLDPYRPLLTAFEYLTIGAFSVEYLLRLWSVSVDPRYARPFVGRVRWALTPMALVDMFAVLPFYVPLVGVDLRFLRVLRVFRFVRVFKVGRYSESLRAMSAVMRDKKADLLSALAILLSLLLVAASLMYYAERDAQPERYTSIPMAVWWVIVQLSGNADVLPTTFAGRVLGALTSVLGVGLFALPAGILASGFSAQLSREERERAEGARGGAAVGEDAGEGMPP
ncbi:MAG: ion transporter [Coriobacteriia bacterium]|nr:ion transporter [Coriobacteriia bacterium]